MSDLIFNWIENKSYLFISEKDFLLELKVTHYTEIFLLVGYTAFNTKLLCNIKSLNPPVSGY